MLCFPVSSGSAETLFPILDEPHWYAVYTRANHEKRVAEQLHLRSVEYFLPLYGTVRRWKDRRVHLQCPLFPSYIFTRVAHRDRLRVLQVPGVVKMVGFEGHPVPIPNGEIESLQDTLMCGLAIEPHPYMWTGRRVRIKNGPLAGHEGFILRRKKHLRFVISMQLIMRSIAVDIDGADLEPVSLAVNASDNGGSLKYLVYGSSQPTDQGMLSEDQNGME